MPRATTLHLAPSSRFTTPAKAHPAKQVYLLEAQSGTLCRILNLYAARGVNMTSIRYDHAAPLTMMLTITTTADPELLRVLVAKAATQVGVIEAAMD